MKWRNLTTIKYQARRAAKFAARRLLFYNINSVIFLFFRIKQSGSIFQPEKIVGSDAEKFCKRNYRRGRRLSQAAFPPRYCRVGKPRSLCQLVLAQSLFNSQLFQPFSKHFHKKTIPQLRLIYLTCTNWYNYNI